VKAIAARVGLVVCAAVMAMGLFGTGTSAADPYVGKTYAEAAARIADKGGTVVISTVVGSQLPTDQCIVAAWHRPTFTRDNFDHDKRQFLLSLNCVAKIAGGGKPGNSLASPEGRAAKAIEARAEAFNSNPARCEKNLENCLNFCNKYGLCSKEVMALF
jgi:hypothetical protein